MTSQPLPRDVKKAVDLLSGAPAHPWRIDSLAQRCGVPRRTLEKHFRRFIGCAPLQFLREQRLVLARRLLLISPPHARVAQIAVDCGIGHFGRFATAYRRRYGELPSSTLKWRHLPLVLSSASVRLTVSSERPAVAVLPFSLIGPQASRARFVADELSVALLRSGWVRIVPPAYARYQVSGSVADDGSGVLIFRLILLDQSAGRYIWAWSAQYAASDLCEATEWLSNIASGAVQSVVRSSEVERVGRTHRKQSTAWELCVRSLPAILAADPAAHSTALELAEQAMQMAPRDGLPRALAAWCHGLRAGHHFTEHAAVERCRAVEIAQTAVALGQADPLSEAMLSATFMLAHDLAAAETHARRALAIDGGSAWGWGRLGWVYAYRGASGPADECFRIARILGAGDPLQFNWSIGIAAANFEQGRYKDAVRHYREALVEEPRAVWVNRFLAAACVHAGLKDEGRKSLDTLRRSFPELTIARVREGLPHTSVLLDRICEGLETLGLRHN